MLLQLIENKRVEQTKLTIEYRTKDKEVERIVEFVQHLEDTDNILPASAGGRLFRLNVQDVLFLESVDRKTFVYTSEEVYETEYKLYEIEEKYGSWDYMRISKSGIVNIKRIKSLKPDFGGKILATMDNGERLYISRQYAPILKEKLGLGGKQ